MALDMTSAKQEIGIVEDDEDMRELLTDFLTGEGYQVRSFTSPFEALRMMRQGTGKLRALISDVGLPGMSGLEFLSLVKKERPEIPVLLISAFGDSVNGKEMCRKGAFDYLMKPFPLSQLHASLRRALSVPNSQTSWQA